MPDRESVTNVRLFDPVTRAFATISPSGATEIASLIRLIGGSFEAGTLPVDTWVTEEINSAPVPIAVSGELLLQNGTVANGEARVQTTSRAELIDSTSNVFLSFVQHIDFDAVDNVTEWGIGDPVVNIFSGDAAFFRNTAGVITIVTRKAGVESIIAEGSFNGSTIAGLDNSFVKDDNIHFYEIIYTLGKAEFFQDRKLIHSFTPLTQIAVTTIHLPNFALNRNINGNTTDNTFKIRALSTSRMGSIAADSDTHTFNADESILLKNSPGKLVSVIITDTGVGGASLELYDALDSAGTPFAIVSLTDSLINLIFNRPLDTGLFVVADGVAFEAIVNWR